MTLKLSFSQTKFSFEIHLHIYKLCSKNQDAGDVESEDASAKMASQSIRLQEIEQENAKLKNRLDRYQKAIANSKEFEKCVGASTTEPTRVTDGDNNNNNDDEVNNNVVNSKEASQVRIET